MGNIAKIKHYDIANGKGIRTSIFFSGCEHHCKNCFNSELWDFTVGRPLTSDIYINEIKNTINEHIAGISILGGEPMHPRNIDITCDLVYNFKKDFPDKTIWLWSGYTLDELLSKEYSEQLYGFYNLNGLVRNILKNIDVLVDGRYIDEQRDLRLKWRGSSNQRVIDVQETIKQKKIVLFDK